MKKFQKAHKRLLVLCFLIVPAFVLSVMWLMFFFTNPKTYTVTLTKNGYQPNNLTIKYGDSIIFKNELNEPFWPASNIHPTHTIYDDFDPKRALHPNESWTFTFTKPGTWRFHDHLFPNHTGIITVLDKKGNRVILTDSCDKVDESDKQRCWDEELAAAVEYGSLDEAFDLFIKIYNSNPEIPKGCHGWAHILGKGAYKIYKEKRDIILRPEISYCGYGFMHGFIEQLVLETGDPKKTREFCTYAQEQLKENMDVYSNCLHGIGHGSVDVEDESKWGNFQAMIDPGIERCESILTDPGELRLCYDGTFNAMHQYEFNNEYKLTFHEDVYRNCRNQKEAVKTSCYFEYTGLTSYITGHNFQKASQLLLSENITDEIAFVSINKMAGDFMQDDIAKPDWEKNVMDCRMLEKKYYDSCMRGILGGFIAHGLPGQQYIKGLEYCSKTYLKEGDKDLCYSYFLPLVHKDSQECLLVDQKFRHYCQT